MPRRKDMNPMPLRFARSAALIVLTFAFSGLLAGMAGAQPVTDLQAEATQLNAQIQANGVKIAALAEQINGAQIKLDAAQAQMAQLEARVHGRAAVIYQTNGQGGPAFFSATNVLDLLVRSKYTSIVAGNDRRLIEQLSQAKRDIAQQRASLAKAKADADAADAQQHRLLAQVTGQLGVLVAQQQQQHQQAALAVSIQRTTPGNLNWAGPPVSGGAGAAVAFAEAQVGKPYQSGAAGPDTYDCSGLTMRAWQAGGVAMAHFSGAQYDAFPKVPMDQLQPGDLVFPSDPSAHVGIYIGGGMMIHATHTGDFVRRAPIVQDGLVMTSAVRP
jgi:cell wall-associated NlpC family hydrolase